MSLLPVRAPLPAPLFAARRSLLARLHHWRVLSHIRNSSLSPGHRWCCRSSNAQTSRRADVGSPAPPGDPIQQFAPPPASSARACPASLNCSAADSLSLSPLPLDDSGPSTAARCVWREAQGDVRSTDLGQHDGVDDHHDTQQTNCALPRPRPHTTRARPISTPTRRGMSGPTGPAFSSP
jgi:hypothetical protein